MSTVRLYLFLLVGVLGVAGCLQDRSNSPATETAPDTAASTQNAAQVPDDTTSNAIRVLVLGNSIAAGSGVSTQEAFPALLQRKVDSLGWNVTIENAGVSGETTAGGLRRIGWLLSNPVDVLLLELGGNDGLRGVDPQVTENNLVAIIDTTLTTYPNARVLLAGMRIPPNLGPQYTEQFRDVYPAVAEQYDRVTVTPFILQDVAGVDSLMQEDGIHPKAKGHRIVAQNVWEMLGPLLAKMRPRDPT